MEIKPEEENATFDTPEVEIKSVAAKADETTSAETPVPDETTPVEPTPSVHSADTIAQAARLDISTEEIESMTPAELKFAIRHAERTSREIAAIRQQVAPKPEPKQEVNPTATLEADLDDETKFDPTVASAIKAVLTQNKQLAQELSSIKPAIEAMHAQRAVDEVNSALDAIKPGFSQEFKTKSEKADRFFGMMNAIAQMEANTGKVTSHAERTKMAIRALGLEPPKEDVLDKRREQFAKGAVGTPVNRKVPEDPVQAVARIQDRARRANKQAEYVPQFND